MALETINIGKYANDGTGDDLRTAFTKVNSNFTSIGIETVSNVGTGVGLFAGKNDLNLTFKTLTSIDGTVILTSSAQSIDLHSNTKLENDTSPKLASHLDLNSHDIINGDIKTTIYGIDVRTLNTVLNMSLQSNGITIDFGSFSQPTGQGSKHGVYEIDLGSFTTASTTDLDFGVF
jgi:hypothetical protein